MFGITSHPLIIYIMKSVLCIDLYIVMSCNWLPKLCGCGSFKINCHNWKFLGTCISGLSFTFFCGCKAKDFVTCFSGVLRLHWKRSARKRRLLVRSSEDQCSCSLSSESVVCSRHCDWGHRYHHQGCLCKTAHQDMFRQVHCCFQSHHKCS